MAKYIEKRSNVVDAFQYGVDADIPMWIFDAIKNGNIYACGNRVFVGNGGSGFIVEKGDFITKDSDGVFDNLPERAFFDEYRLLKDV